MAGFSAHVDVRAEPERVWRLLTDWPAHERWIPLTSVTVLTENPGGVGARFVTRSGVRPLAFEDPLEVTEWQPPAGDRPGRCALVHAGRMVLGRAELEVLPLPTGLTRATWSEQVELAPVRLTRRLEPVLGPVIGVAGRFGFGRALRKMAAELEGAPR